MSKALKSDVEAGFLKNVKEATEAVKEATSYDPALQALNSLVTTYAVKKAADALSETFKTEATKEEQKTEEKEKEKEKKKSGDLLAVLFTLKKKGLVDDEMFRTLAMLSLFENGDSGNMLLPLLLTSQSSPQPKNDDLDDLRKEIKKIKKAIVKMKKESVGGKTENQVEVQGMSQTDLMKAMLESQTKLIEGLLTNLLTNNKQNALDDLQKLTEIIKAMKPETNGTQNLLETIELLQKLGLVSDKYKEKLLELKKEIIEKKLATEAELEKMKLEKEKIRAQSEVAVAERQAATIKSLGDLVVKSVVRGIVESVKPSEAQKVESQITQQEKPLQEPPQTPPKPVNEITVTHTDDQGNELHKFKIPLEVLKKNVAEIDNQKYYKVVCPYDNQELYIPINQIENGGEENGS